MKKMIQKKSILLLTLVGVVLLGSVGGTLAYLTDKAGPLANIFNPSEVTSSVHEPGWTDGGIVKQNVQIQNTGDIDANIRAAIVVTWKLGNNTLPEVPVVGTDYSLEIGSSWNYNSTDGFYYYTETVSPGGYTKDLIVKCETLAKYDDDRVLCVEVIGSAIQQQPTGGTTWAVPTAGN